MYRSFVPIALVAMTALVGTARAQPSSSDAAAEKLFDEAVELRRAGRHAAACAKFRESQVLSPARGTLLNIAECYERAGKLASAWASYSVLLDQSEAAGDRERLAIARSKRAELDSKLARVTIVVREPISGLVVERNGVAIPAGVLGTSIPVDAGRHVIEARAPGHEPWSSTAEVRDGARARVEIPALDVVPPPAASTHAPGATATTAVRDRAAAGGSADHRGRRIAVIAGAGLGAATIATGLGFGLRARNQRNDAGPYCDDDLVCDGLGFELIEDANHSARISTILVASGAAVIGISAVLWLTTPENPRAARLAPALGPDRVAFVVSGAF